MVSLQYSMQILNYAVHLKLYNAINIMLLYNVSNQCYPNQFNNKVYWEREGDEWAQKWGYGLLPCLSHFISSLNNGKHNGRLLLSIKSGQ